VFATKENIMNDSTDNGVRVALSERALFSEADVSWSSGKLLQGLAEKDTRTILALGRLEEMATGFSEAYCSGMRKTFSGAIDGNVSIRLGSATVTSLTTNEYTRITLASPSCKITFGLPQGESVLAVECQQESLLGTLSQIRALIREVVVEWNTRKDQQGKTG
jgi:hypothetical protein